MNAAAWRGPVAETRREGPLWTWRVVLLCGLLMLLQFAALPTMAGERAQATDSVDISAVADNEPLVAQLEWLEDPGGQLDAGAVVAREGWRHATRASLNRGYTSSAFWLRGAFHNGSDRPVKRWLVAGVVRIEDVRFYHSAPGAGASYAMVPGGNRLPLDSHPVKAALTVFPIELAPGERMDYALRMQSRSALSMDVGLWRPEAFRQVELRDSMIEMLMTGSMLTMALYTLVLGLVRRDRVLLLLSAFIVAQMMQDLAFQGFLYRHVLVEGGNWVLRGPSLWSAIATAMFSAMAMAFAGLQRVPLWRWTYRILILAACVFALGSVFGDYSTNAAALIDLLFVCNAVWVVSMLDGWRRGFANAPLFLLAFAGNSFPLLVRLLVIHGVLPDIGLSASGIAWSTNLSMLLMISMLVVSRSRQLLRKQREAQQALLEVRLRERERLERAVDERTRELQAALIAADEASSAKSDFLARVSHDLRTPLTSIIGFADLVQAAGREDAERGRIIRRSASHMLAMVNDLIDYAGGADPDALQPAPVYFHALLESIAQEGASLAAKRSNRFSLEVCGPLPPILMVDDKRLRQVLGNLIDNAAKFTRDGSIVLSLECGQAMADGTVTVIFAVADTGQGIATSDQERIFEPFARLDAARLQPGIGLGLPIVRQWVQHMGGTLAIESTPSVGTRVSIALTLCPVAENEIARHFVTDAIGVLPAIDGGGRRIWIAEDTAEIRDFLTDELASLGFEVESEADGQAMIERIAAGRDPGPDLILTDHMMPDSDGMAVMAASRRHLPGVPVVVLSAVPQAIDAGGANEGDRTMRGYDATLLKPVNLAELRNTLARLLALSRSSDDALVGEALVSPAAPELADARRLIELGAISDLIDWAEALGARIPACRAFTQQAGLLARMGDLEALRALCRG